MEDKIYMVVDRVEDITYQGERKGVKVTDKAGNSVNVKGGKKGGDLFERWDDIQPDSAYEFEMGVFKKDGNEYPFVIDFKAVEVALAEQEAKKAPTPPPKPPTTAPQTAKEATRPVSRVDGKNKAFAVSYMKDLVVPSITPDNPLTLIQLRLIVKGARFLEAYMDGQMEIDDEDLTKLIMEVNKA